MKRIHPVAAILQTALFLLILPASGSAQGAGSSGLLGPEANRLNGVNIGGAAVLARERQRGITIGLLNRAGNLKGLQLGLLNIAGNNRFPFRILPILNLNLKG